MEGDVIKRDYGSLDGTDHLQVSWDDRLNYTPIVNSNGGYQQLGYGVIGDPNPDFVYGVTNTCLLYTSPSPRDRTRSRMPSSA